MHARLLSVACATLLLPAAMFAAAPTASAARTADAGASPIAAFADAGFQHGDWRDDDDRRCGRGRAWGCRRDRDEGRYDRSADRWERERWERAQYERARWERQRWERERWERARYRARYGYNDRRYERYDGSAVACLRAGGRVLGAVLVICVP